MTDKGLRRLVAASSTISVLACTGCFLPSYASGHENFKRTMQSEVGRNASDRYAFRNHYRNFLVEAHKLQNGNSEEQFRAGVGPSCRVFFEINDASQQIVGWRYEGSQDDCVIPP